MDISRSDVGDDLRSDVERLKDRSRSSRVDVHEVSSITQLRSPMHDVRSSTRDVRSSANDVRSSTRDVRPSAHDVRSSTRDTRPSARDVRSATRTHDVRSSTRDIRPTRYDFKGSPERFMYAAEKPVNRTVSPRHRSDSRIQPEQRSHQRRSPSISSLQSSSHRSRDQPPGRSSRSGMDLLLYIFKIFLLVYIYIYTYLEGVGT